MRIIQLFDEDRRAIRKLSIHILFIVLKLLEYFLFGAPVADSFLLDLEMSPKEDSQFIWMRGAIRQLQFLRRLCTNALYPVRQWYKRWENSENWNFLSFYFFCNLYWRLIR